MTADSSENNISAQAFALISNGVSLGCILDYNETEYEAMYALGHNHYNQKHYLDAAKCFGFLVTNNTTEPRFMKAFACSLQMLKNYRDAIQYHSLASLMNLEDPLPTFHTAECFVALAMPEEAREALTLVISQCGQPQWEELRQRSQALLSLLTPKDDSRDVNALMTEASS